jgi:hypothetical protein
MRALTLNQHETMKSFNRTMVGALGVLSVAALCAQEVTVLESFEDNIDAASPLTGWGGRADLDPIGVTLSQYTRTGDDDLFVSHGEKSLKVTLSGQEWWSGDFQVTLSEEASELLREAAATGDTAQYVLRWDYVFPPSGTTAWMNSQIQEFGGISDQLESNDNRRSMSLQLDLMTPLPEGQLVLQFAQNFDFSADPFTSLDVYMDNIRLIDTYVPRAVPNVHVLQSFEDPNNPVGSVTNFTDWGGGTRTTYAQYTATDEGDIKVTHGSHSLEVTYSGAGGWGADFTVPLNDTMLAEILKLDFPAEERPTPAELQRYTLRFDVIYPVAGDIGATWMNTSYDTLGGGFPWSQTAAFGGVRTYSITLDQLTWADWEDPTPVIMVMANSDWTATEAKVYFDNFVLIDTGEAGGTVPQPTITGHEFASGQMTITWGSVTGGTYAVERKGALDGTWSAIAEDLVAAGASTSYTDASPPAGQAFYRVVGYAPAALFETGFEPGEDLSGWTEVITLGSTQWEVGVPTTGPGSAHTGVNVLATKLAGDYGIDQQVGYRSPAIDLTGRDAATLQFYHYYEFEPVDEGGEAFDWGEVNLLDATSGQNLLPGSVPALRFTGAFRNWRRTSYSLPPEALGKSIRIEFKLISDVFTTMPGWYIDDIRID